MAYNNPPEQLPPDGNLDVQKIKLAIKYLSTTNGLTESEENLNKAIERDLNSKLHSSLIPLLKGKPDNFDIQTDGKATFVSALTKLELCPTHCSVHGTCQAPICNKLHICKFYLLSNLCEVARTGKVCKYGHDITTSHNQNLLMQHYIGDLNVETLRTLFRSIKSRCEITTPSLCEFYNLEKGCTKNERCSFLHLCKFYISGTCKHGKECRRSHNLLEPNVQDFLEKYGISTKRKPKEVLADLQKLLVARGQSSESKSTFKSNEKNLKGFSSNPNLSGKTNLPLARDQDNTESTLQSTSAEICIYHLRGKCHFGGNCRRHHKDSMYQWQRRQKGNTADDSWTDFNSKANFELERNFTDIENEKCDIKLDSKEPKLQINFEKWIAETEGSSSLEIRRLSTESSAVQKFQPLATQWKWYWKDENGKWIQYGESNVSGYKAMVDSESLEQKYQENPTGQVKFETTDHKYLMDFQKMTQKNVVHITERGVRRRPTFVPQVEVEKLKKKSANTGNAKTTATSMVVHAPLAYDPLSNIPTDWSVDRQKSPDDISDHFVLSTCSSSSEEYKKVKDLFFKTMPESTNIVQIQRIENVELWITYVSKREKMKKKRKGGDINELQLFHGTKQKFIDLICKQGFDFRISGSITGTLYGKGTYFANTAKYSDCYTDSVDNTHKMFVVRVLAGDYAPGSSTFVRPPPRNPNDPSELFDSCVDKLQNPLIYVIFTFDQMYPEYVIEYKKI